MTPIQIRLIEYGIIALALLAAYGAWHHRVFQEGYQAAVSAQQKAVEEGKKQYEAKSKEVSHLSDADLRRRLCKWMRDSDMSSCLKTLAPFSP